MQSLFSGSSNSADFWSRCPLPAHQDCIYFAFYIDVLLAGVYMLGMGQLGDAVSVINQLGIFNKNIFNHTTTLMLTFLLYT